MLCPKCKKNETKVIDSREDEKSIRRRRECLNCQNRFTTYEYIEIPDLLVIKKNGDRESFKREKIIEGLKKACEKRPVCLASLEKIADEIEQNIYNSGNEEIPSRLIGEMVMEALKKTDQVAYIRFASVYRSFKDLESFEKELKKIIEFKAQ